MIDLLMLGQSGRALDWYLLGFYFALALGVSFLCSLMEASILSLPRSHVERLKQEGRASAAILDQMKSNIDRPLAAILTLNTIANTFGAAGVGAQALRVFGSTWVALTSVALTLCILIFSEIIPKTAGAIYTRQLAPLTAFIIRLMIIVSFPLVWLLEKISRVLFHRSPRHHVVSREELALIAEMSGETGALRGNELLVIRNVLRLRELLVKDVMTPRTVVGMLQANMTAAEAIGRCESGERRAFSRYPVYDENPDNVLGIVLRRDLSDAVRKDAGDVPLRDMLRPIHAVPDVASVDNVLWQFFSTGHHMFLVVDEHGGTAGIITLEDAIETMLGTEIVDETDAVIDMRHLAERRRKRMPTEPAAEG